MKLTPKMLRGLIREAIQSREPGSPLWSPEKTKRTTKTEAFGAFDAEPIPYNPKGKGRRAPVEMKDINFENTHKELFSQALNSVVEEFVETMRERFNSEYNPNGEPDEDGTTEYMMGEFESEIHFISEEMREDLLNSISKWLDTAEDRL
jgi:hypothetical protein